jgi:hypothetical protein
MKKHKQLELLYATELLQLAPILKGKNDKRVQNSAKYKTIK